MKLIKHTLFAVLISLACTPAFAVGPYDGIYYCNMDVSGTPSSTYITVNSSGTLGVFAVPYLTPGQFWSGYGIGQWSGTTLSGTTNYGGAFTATYVDHSIDFQAQVDLSGYFYEATGTCRQII